MSKIYNETLFPRNFKYSTIDPCSRGALQLEIGQVRSKTRLVRGGGASCASERAEIYVAKVRGPVGGGVSRGKRQ